MRVCSSFSACRSVRVARVASPVCRAWCRVVFSPLPVEMAAAFRSVVGSGRSSGSTSTRAQPTVVDDVVKDAYLTEDVWEEGERSDRCI